MAALSRVFNVELASSMPHSCGTPSKFRLILPSSLPLLLLLQMRMMAACSAPSGMAGGTPPC